MLFSYDVKIVTMVVLKYLIRTQRTKSSISRLALQSIHIANLDFVDLICQEL